MSSSSTTTAPQPATSKLTQLADLCRQFPQLPTAPPDHLAAALELLPLLDQFSELQPPLPQLLSGITSDELYEAIKLVQILRQEGTAPTPKSAAKPTPVPKSAAKPTPAPDPATEPTPAVPPKPQRTTLTKADRAKIDVLRQRQYSAGQIGKLIGTTKNVVDGYLYHSTLSFDIEVVERLRQLDLDDPNLPAPRGHANQTSRQQDKPANDQPEPA